MDINSINLQAPQPFTKIYMYEALQHFQEEQFSLLLKILLALSSDNTIFLFGSVPDKQKLRNFYNTPDYQREYRKRKRQNNDAIGTWWDKSFLSKTCMQYGLKCNFLPQHESLHTAHYRFDVICSKE